MGVVFSRPFTFASITKCETQNHVILLLRPHKIRSNLCAKWTKKLQVTKQQLKETYKICQQFIGLKKYFKSHYYSLLF